MIQLVFHGPSYAINYCSIFSVITVLLLPRAKSNMFQLMLLLLSAFLYVCLLTVLLNKL